MSNHKVMRHRKSHRRSKKNFVGKSVSKGVNMVKSTSKKYMPKVKSSLENVGSAVSSTAQKSIPFLQKKTRGMFEMLKMKKTRKHRKH
jgi:hypothetical protein